MQKWLSILVALISLLLGNNTMAQSPQIKFNWLAKVSQKHFVLKDVARIETDDKQLKRDLENLQVARSPIVGSEIFMNTSTIKRIVLRRFPELRGVVKWLGADEVNIRRPGQRVKPNQLVDVAQTYLEGKLEKRYRDFETLPITPSRLYLFPKGKLKYVAYTEEFEKPSKRMRIWVYVYHQHEQVAKVPIWFNVSATQRVLVAKRKLKNRTRLRKKDFKVKEVDITSVKNTIPENAKLDRYWLNAKVKKGSVITQSQLRKQPDVKRGYKVTVRVKVDGLVITMDGLAKQDANMGDTTRVENQSSKKVFQATVVGKNLVEVNGE